MADRIVKHFEIKHGTQQKFDDLPVKSQDALYFITDNDTFQRKLTAGTNINIDENTNEISAKDVVNYNNISNCITEIPQDIKLELNNGTLTLKAGSKVYVPNGKNTDGSNRFDVITIESDISRNTFGTASITVILMYSNGTLSVGTLAYATSGTTEPTTSNWTFYNTTTNLLYDQAKENYKSLPIAVLSITAGVVTSIDQVFNGFGYIGSTKFILPGVKGLIPNGRNTDGTLNNTILSITEVKTFTGASTDDSVVGVVGNNNITNYHSANLSYNPDLNLLFNNGVAVDMIPYTNSYSQVSGKIDSNIKFKTVFHALDYNDAVKYSDKETVVGLGMPDYSAGTTATQGTEYTATTNCWLYMQVQSTSSSAGGDVSKYIQINGVEVVSVGSFYYNRVSIMIPCKKGDTYKFVNRNTGSGSYTFKVFPAIGG